MTNVPNLVPPRVGVDVVMHVPLHAVMCVLDVQQCAILLAKPSVKIPKDMHVLKPVQRP